LVGESGKSVGTIARELDLTETALRRWVQQAEVDAGRGPAGVLTTNEREELAQLRRENKKLLWSGKSQKNSRVRCAAPPVSQKLLVR
jgi:transposase